MASPLKFVLTVFYCTNVKTNLDVIDLNRHIFYAYLVLEFLGFNVLCILALHLVMDKSVSLKRP